MIASKFYFLKLKKNNQCLWNYLDLWNLKINWKPYTWRLSINSIVIFVIKVNTQSWSIHWRIYCYEMPWAEKYTLFRLLSLTCTGHNSEFDLQKNLKFFRSIHSYLDWKFESYLKHIIGYDHLNLDWHEIKTNTENLQTFELPNKKFLKIRLE